MAGGWTGERIEQVHDLWREGLSAREIASRLGVARNAVILRVHAREVQERPRTTAMRATEVEERRRTRAIEREKAEDVAIALLKENLSPAQRRQFEKDGCFEVTGGRTGKRYRIRGSCRVECLDGNGGCVCRLCFYPRGGLAAGDVMLAQKFALELFESEALWVANKIGQVRCSRFSRNLRRLRADQASRSLPAVVPRLVV